MAVPALPADGHPVEGVGVGANWQVGGRTEVGECLAGLLGRTAVEEEGVGVDGVDGLVKWGAVEEVWAGRSLEGERHPDR